MEAGLKTPERKQTKEKTMVKYEVSEDFAALKNFDTPSITNAVASYPNDPKCLCLYNAWKGKWYTDQTLKCMFPEVGRKAGYVVTVVYGPIRADQKSKYTLHDVFKAIEKAPKPVCLAVKQDFPEDMKGINGLCGGMMMSSFKSLGVEGVISDGPSRDIDEVRQFDIQYLLTGITPGHGEFDIYAINVPVSICGMDVMPGDIVHMDENGACKFPPEYLHEVVERCKKFQAEESDKQRRILEANGADEVWAILSGTAYGEEK